MSSAQLIFDRKTAIKMSGMSEKAYNRSLIAMQNGLGVKLVSYTFILLLVLFCGFTDTIFKCFECLIGCVFVLYRNKLDIRELGIQFGCIRLIPLVHKALSLYVFDFYIT